MNEVINLSLDLRLLYPIEAIVPLIPALIALGGVIVAATVIIIMLSEPNSETVSIAILGEKGAGKSTMWNYLRGIKGTPQVTTISDIEEFVFATKSDGTQLKIKRTKDLGGGQGFVQGYDDVIVENGCFIFYFMPMDSVKDKDTIERIKARKDKIYRLIDEKKLKACGVRFVLTYADKFRDSEKQKEWEDRTCKELGIERKYLLSGSMVEGGLREEIKDLIAKAEK